MRGVRIAAAAAAFCLSAPSMAGEFEIDGTFRISGGAVAVQAFDLPLEGFQVRQSDSALMRGRVGRVQAFEGPSFAFELPAQAMLYRASVWVRLGEVAAFLVPFELETIEPVDEQDEEELVSRPAEEMASLFPTGRVTSDGWVELANEVRLDGRTHPMAALALFATQTAEVDAFELVPVRPLTEAELSRPCEGVRDQVCGDGQVCLYGNCRNVDGWVPPIPEDREDVAAYLGSRLELLFGPFQHRTIDLPSSRVALERMRSATTRWGYWNAFTESLRRAHDGHTTTSSLSDFVLSNQRPWTVCFIEGDADATHGIEGPSAEYLDILVSHVARVEDLPAGDAPRRDRTLGMRRGDRLVRVDGMHPIDWARSLIGDVWGLSPTSNRNTFAELAEQLRGLVPRYAHSIEVIRCEGDAAACGPVERIELSSLPRLETDEAVAFVACDNRPLRHLPNSPSNHGGSVTSGILNASDEAELIYGLEWNSLYTSGNDGVGPALTAAVRLWRGETEEPAARGVILDHRTGNGGTILAPSILWDFAVPRRPSDHYFDRQRAEDEQPSLAEGLAIFERAVANGYANFAGSDDPTDVPVALLITRDVSASDWLPLGMKGAPTVRIFGPFETNGAFSTRYAFGYWLGISYLAATGDTVDHTGRTLNGFGVEPDVVVRPLQSDLLVDRDTVFEAALAWVREELAANGGGQ